MSDARPLLIDLRSAALPLSHDQLLDWGAGRQVFVSSLITDLPAERAAVRTAIEDIGAQPVMFEDLGGQDVSADQAYLAGVHRSDVYVGIFTERYGVRLPSGYSATHAEFSEAETVGARIALFIRGLGGPDMDGPQRDLIAGAQNLYTTSSFTSVEELQRRVSQRLREIATEDLTPWVRIGRVVVRARELTTDGSTTTVVTEVRSNAVHAELVQYRDHLAGSLPFVSPTEAKSVQLTALSSSTASTQTHVERITLREQAQQGNPMRMNMNGIGPNEYARRALSDVLFGTSELEGLRFGSANTDPLALIRGQQIDDAVLRPVVRLLLGAYLFENGHARTIDAFHLGPARNGKRHLKLQWSPPNPYSNAPDPAPVLLEGDLQLR
ncbi:DUF4062 domain-containing protein [Amnibacterium kyonggiense]|uniref:Uncharacterized protein DUF4062 n=1 Tax=Amnibacterium kyonggiense TaxID=595671 RepID=A0A4R7FR91_9MICO|nr:DUF4062 domain-containing protein [Amnibacterium kyonggiense]TDS80332.1 uncharacterized protein DUF4062 [Amnibacterium kyonggiense]